MRSSLAAYIPEHLVRGGGDLPEPPSAASRHAVLLLSDIAGFTALTERLAAGGRRGAEQVADAVNAVFRPAIDAIERNGGSVVTFGGDALLSMFRSLAAARAAAEAVRRAAGRARAAGDPVRITQVIHGGRICELHLGGRDRRHYLLAGPAARRIARLHETAPRGGTLASPGGSSFRAAGATGPRRTRASWESFLPAPLVPYLGKTPGGFRPAAVLFLETRGDAPRPLQRFFQELQDLLDRHGGTLLKSDVSPLGTKWMCLFGVPRTHEDDVERAARVARGLVPSRIPLRGGLHAGVVAMLEIGTRSRRSFDVMGDAVNTAARTASHAAWGEILVTEAVRRSTASLVTVPRGAREVKGKSQPLEIHALAGVTAKAPRQAPTHALVDRRREIRELSRAVARCRQGAGTCLAILGEAGMGKSRLKWEVATTAADLALHEGRAVSFSGMAYWVVAELIRNMLGLGENERSDRIRQALLGDCRRTSVSDADASHLLALLGVAPDDGTPLLLDGRARRRSTLAAVATYVAARCRKRPHLLVLEDLHVADELSIEVIEQLARTCRDLPLVLLLLARPSYHPPPGARVLRLAELPRRDAAKLVAALLPGQLSAVPALVDRGDGNPLFLEELAHHVGSAGRDGEDVPGTLEAVLEARLDRLPRPARATAELAAVIGRSFMRDLLVAIQGPAASKGIEELMAAGLLIGRGALEAGAPTGPARVEHAFRHALVRDVAYASILVKRRKVLHRAVARTIERVLASDPETYLPLRAHHWDAGDRPGRARPLYLAAARRAVAIHALDEAETLLRRHLALGEADAQALAARFELGGVVLFRKGRYADGVKECAHARELARRLGDRALEGRIEKHLGDLTRLLARMDDAREHYDRALVIAEEIGDRTLQAITLSGLGVLHAERGRLHEALPLQEQSVALHVASGDVRGQASALGNLGNLQAMGGRLDEAASSLTSAIALFLRSGDERSAAMASGNLAFVRQQQGRLADARPLLAEALSALRRVGDRPAEAYALCQAATVDAAEGDLAGARRSLEAALTIHRCVGDLRIEAATLIELAGVRRRLGHLRAARTMLDGALALLDRVGDPETRTRVLAERERLLAYATRRSSATPFAR